jgi:hypothetical protein
MVKNPINVTQPGRKINSNTPEQPNTVKGFAGERTF